MRLPQFTAEAVLSRTITRYTNTSIWSGRHGTGSVMAQHLFCPPECAFFCSPPGCERHPFGPGGCVCHCECPPNFG